MSVTIQDKIDQFSKQIFSRIENQFDEKRQRLTEEYKVELEKHKAEIERKKKEIIDSAMAKAERERVKLMAKVQNEEHHKLITKKQQFLQEIMKRLYQYAADYTNSSDYQGYMEKNLESLVLSLRGTEEITIYVLQKDMELASLLTKQILAKHDIKLNFNVLEASQNIVGGLIAEDLMNQLQVDLTLKALIEANKDIVGAAITRKFNEVSAYEQ